MVIPTTNSTRHRLGGTSLVTMSTCTQMGSVHTLPELIGCGLIHRVMHSSTDHGLSTQQMWNMHQHVFSTSRRFSVAQLRIPTRFSVCRYNGSCLRFSRVSHSIKSCVFQDQAKTTGPNLMKLNGDSSLPPPPGMSDELIACGLIFKITWDQMDTNQNHSWVHNTAETSFGLMKLYGGLWWTHWIFGYGI